MQTRNSEKETDVMVVDDGNAVDEAWGELLRSGHLLVYRATAQVPAHPSSRIGEVADFRASLA